MAASAGTVTLDLDANSVKMIRELQRAERQTKRSSMRMRRDMERSFKRMAQVSVALGVALAATAKVSISFADRIGKTADKVGVGVEALQELRFAAQRAGIEQNTLDMALQRFTRRVAEAANGTGEARKVLAELGIQLRDNEGKIRKTEDLLGDVADALAAGYEPADQLRIAFKLFDSEGAALVNMLREGSDGLQQMRDRARSLGVVMEERLVRDAEKAADKMGDLQKVLQINIATAVTQNADAIIALTNSLITFIVKVGEATQAWGDWLARQGIGVDSIDEIRERGNELLREKINIENELARTNTDRNWLQKLTGTDGPEIANLKNRLAEIRAEMEALQTQAVALQQTDAARSPIGGGEDGAPLRPMLPEPAQVKEKADRITGIIQDLQNQIRGFGGDRYDQVLLRLVDTEATEEQIMAVRNMVSELRLLESDEERRAEAVQQRTGLEAEYQSLVSSTRNEIEDHAALVERINQLYEAGVIPSVQEYADLLGRVNTDFAERQDQVSSELDEFGKQAARNLQTHFADFLFDPFEDGLDGMLKGFSETIRRMAAEAAAAAIFKKIFGGDGDAGLLGGLFGGSGGGFGGFISSLFGGGKAMGGTITTGRAYLVGERGPELVVPQAMGYVLTNDQITGPGQTVTNVYLPPNVPRRTAQQTAYEVANRSRRASQRNR